MVLSSKAFGFIFGRAPLPGTNRNEHGILAVLVLDIAHLILNLLHGNLATAGLNVTPKGLTLSRRKRHVRRRNA